MKLKHHHPIHPVRNPASRVQCLETRGKYHRTANNTSDVLGLSLAHRTSLIKIRFYESGVTYRNYEP